ncbi:L-rhamnose isomerase [Deinococcus roseus]|uniref:L-rhamnose isomerase n=1 Tax=Deinococcus roseus TaxID=392414 RepID=A0ABQ2D232_9DEIO|nr:L-rhamnose isomerase [Deinococcus roseus]GGJ42611.1 L-rhamnose isomerase [Deinococcus roseus]
MNTETIKARLKQQKIETPSWGYGNSGTRFKTFPAPGAASTVWEKVEDAAFIHSLTGIAPSVALHIPWDRVEDYSELKKHAQDLGIQLGAINPNVFQDVQYKLGSVTNPDAAVRAKATQHLLDCVEVMKQTGSRDLSLWFADGTNYLGQDDLRKRKRYLREALQQVHDRLPEDGRMLIEYKLFEPAFYHTDLADWGLAYLHAVSIGEKAQVLVDLGHHAQGTNIEHIVSTLLDAGRLGGFHFNARRYADDDLVVGTTNPLELFAIYLEIVQAENDPSEALRKHVSEVAFMIDQSHNIEHKLEAMLQSVLNCQEAYAKALSVDFDLLTEAREQGEVLKANRIVMDAFYRDVRPLLRELREEQNLPADPYAALEESDHLKKVLRDRQSSDVGGGFPS